MIDKIIHLDQFPHLEIYKWIGLCNRLFDFLVFEGMRILIVFLYGRFAGETIILSGSC